MTFFVRLFQVIVFTFIARRLLRVFGVSDERSGDSQQVRGYPESSPTLDLGDVEDAVFEEIEEH